MSAYKRRDNEFDAKLSAMRDEQRAEREALVYIDTEVEGTPIMVRKLLGQPGALAGRSWMVNMITNLIKMGRER